MAEESDDSDTTRAVQLFKECVSTKRTATLQTVNGKIQLSLYGTEPFLSPMNCTKKTNNCEHLSAHIQDNARHIESLKKVIHSAESLHKVIHSATKQTTKKSPSARKRDVERRTKFIQKRKNKLSTSTSNHTVPQPLAHQEDPLSDMPPNNNQTIIRDIEQPYQKQPLHQMTSAEFQNWKKSYWTKIKNSQVN